jgi:hypothetical protein
LTGTFGSLASSTNYYIYAKSTDIYGGTNSTANSDSTTRATTATVTVQTGSLTYGWGAESSAFTEDTEVNKHIISGNTYRLTDAFAVPGWRAGDPGPYVGTETYTVTNVKVYARVVVSGINITSSSRSFIVEWSGASTSFASVNLTSPYYDGQQAPFNNNSGTLERSESAGFTLGYDNGRGGRLRFKGAGTIGTVQTSPSDERIRVRCEITMKKKTWTAFDTRGSYSY